MKKIYLSLMAFILCFFTACDDSKKPAQPPQENVKKALIVGISVDYPPFAFYKNGNKTGFEIELIHEIAKNLNLEIDIKDMSFDSLIGALQSQRIDLAISAISATEERKKSVDFTIPYCKSFSVILVDEKSPIVNVNDLEDKIVGVQMGSTYESYVKNQFQPKIKNLQIQALAKVPDLIQDYNSGRVKALIMGNVEGKAVIDNHKTFKIVPISGTEVTYAIALPKDSKLLNSFNEQIKHLQTTSYLAKLEKKYF